MAEATEKQRRDLAAFIKGLLGGTIDIGYTLMPLLGAYQAAKADPQWREVGFAAWLEEDPQAAEMLVRVFSQVQSTVPKTTRDRLVLALGGIPGED